MTPRPGKPISAMPAWGAFPLAASSLLRDLPVILAGLALFYALLSMAHYWTTPVHPGAEISLHASALPKYAMYSVLRIALAYALSLSFGVAYGYIAAYHRGAEQFMIPLLDILQSIPVLSFLPGVMLSMVALFPSRQLGIELGSILLILPGKHGIWHSVSIHRLRASRERCRKSHRFTVGTGGRDSCRWSCRTRRLGSSGIP